MELYTLNRKFLKQDIIDEFISAIWTERYYGDSDVELVVPAKSDLIKKLPVGTFLGFGKSDEVMIIETVNIEDGQLKVYGMSLLPWMNNRFIRTTDKHEDKTWSLTGGPAGWALWAILFYMCVEGSPYLNGTYPIGISNPQRLAVPGLGLDAHDNYGDNLTIPVTFGPVYDAMREIAVAHEIGMQIILKSATEDSYFLGFRSYRGLDRTSGQTENPVVRFSPQMDSFTDIKELRSAALFKTLVYTFATQNPNGLATVPGSASLSGPQYIGFDLRAVQVFADDITTDTDIPDAAALIDLLNVRANHELETRKFIKAVDGEIVPTNQFKYGVHYTLGDLIEVQGNSEIVSKARITEHIYAQDNSGERTYPTVTMLD